tara:strand:+ start:97 stop:588 length:492 start_codon:yes stop_codon:yes gene_type:complete
MTNGYVQFCEALAVDNDQEYFWLKAAMEVAAFRCGGTLEDLEGIVSEYQLRETGRPLKDYINKDEVAALFKIFEEPYLGFEIEGDRGERTVHLSGSDAHQAAGLVQLFLKRFKPNLYWKLECGFYVEDFGGLAVFVTADQIQTYDTNQWLTEKAEEFRKASTV